MVLRGENWITSQAESTINKQLVMIKQTSKIIRAKQTEYFSVICSDYSKIENETIVPFIGYCEDSDSEKQTYSIVTEYQHNLSLEILFVNDYLLEWWDFTRKIIFIYGVAYGIDYLHQNSILHQNLNFSNILVSAKCEPKISDFEITSIFPIDFGKIPDNRLIFIAPEIIDGNKYSKESDIYSLGVISIMILMDSMNILNKNLSGEDLISQIKLGLLRSLPNCIPTCMHELLLSLISTDPAKRPTISSFLETLQSFFPIFEENENFQLQMFTDYKNKITLAEDQMDEECKQTKHNADNGDPEAMYLYAYYRKQGIHCVKNETEALRYYQRSADCGFEKAINALNALKRKSAPTTIPDESSTGTKAKININKLHRLKEKLRNKKKSVTVVPEEKNLISDKVVNLKLEEIDSFKEFSRLANDDSFNEDPISIEQITKEIDKHLDKGNNRLPTEANREIIKKSNFIITEQSESRLCKILNYIKYRVPVLLEGPTGTSKTLSAEIVCKILNDLENKDKVKYEFEVDGKDDDKFPIELIRFNLSSETKTKDLIGRYVGNPNSWAGISQENGPFYRAFSEGKILLLDEINLASPSVLQCIEEALDSGVLSIEIPGKPLIPIPMHKNFRLIATQNPNKGLFAHKRQDLGLKFYSRFQVINFPAFTSEELGEIAKGLAKQFNYTDKAVISQLVSFHKEWTENPEIQDDAQCFTIREMAATVRALGNHENVYDTIMTIYGARYQEKKRNDLINVLKKREYSKLNVKGKEFEIPEEFTNCFPNESLKRTIKSALFSLKNGRHIIIAGKEGCGKTQVALWISHYFNTVIREEILRKSKKIDKTLTEADKNRQFYCICTEDTKVADLVGHQSPAGKAETGDEIIVWVSGFLTDAIKEGKCSVLESIDEAPATVTERLNGLLDQKYDNQTRYFEIPENPKENRIEITDSFRILATCDVEQIGFVSPAFLNRFDVIVLEDQITPDSNKKDFDDLSEILCDRFYKEICQKKKMLGIKIPSIKKLAPTIGEYQKVSSSFRADPKTWNNISKMSKACKAVSTFLVEFQETRIDKRESIIDFALNLLSSDRSYVIPKEIEEILLDKLQEGAKDKSDTKSTDPEFYFKNSALLCTFMAKLMAFSLIQQPVCVSGPTGAGKTSAARKFSRMRPSHSKSQFQMHSFHAGTKTSQFYGTATLANGQIKFIEGTLTTALISGDVFIADEFNLSPPSVMKSLAPALEQTAGSNIFIPGIDQSINISSEFFFIACQNELGTLGRNAIPETISPRFAYLDYPKPELKDLQTICVEIAQEKDDDGEESCISDEIAEKIAGYMQDINSLSSPYITPWSLRDISKIFRRIRFQAKKYNRKNYIGIDNYHHIYFYTLSSVPQKDIEKAIKQIQKFFEKFNSGDSEDFALKYEKDYKEPPAITPTENGYFIMKGLIGVRVENILLNMLKKSILQDGRIHEDEDVDFSDLTKEFDEFKFSELASLWNTAFQVCLSDNREPLLLMGNSGFKTFLAQQIIQNASIIPLNQETTVAQLLGSSGFFTSSEAKHFYINNLCNICYKISSERIKKLHELQDKWEKNSLTKEDIEPVVKNGLTNNPDSFKYMIKHLSESIFTYTDEDKCVLSNTTLEFRPGLFLNAILQKKSLILKDLSNLPTIVLERFNELFSGKQNITLTEDIHDTFTNHDNKELTDFNKSFRVIGTCPANTPSKLSEAVLSRFTVIATPEYDYNERKIVLTSLCNINKFDFQIEDIQLLLKVSEQIETSKLKPYTFSQMIKTVQLTSMINKLNPSQPKFNLAIAVFRLLSGLEHKDKKETLFNIIKTTIYPNFPEVLNKNDNGTCPLEFPEDEFEKKGILSQFTNLFITEPRSHHYNSKKTIAYTNHFCDILDVIHLSIAVHNPLILEGPPGQGKHTAIEYVANLLSAEVIYITISQSTKVDDLLGKLKIERRTDGIHVEFTKSKLVEAISSESSNTDKPIIVIENINNATPAVLNCLLTIFNIETKNILLPSGETMEKGEFNLIGIFNNQQSTSTRDKLPTSLINSTIYYVVKDPLPTEIQQVVNKEFLQFERENEAVHFYSQFYIAKNFLRNNHLPDIFTLNDISKYLLFRNKTATVFPNTATIMQMIFVYRFFQESFIDEIRKELGYEVMTFMPSFRYDNTNTHLLIQVADDQKVLPIPLIKLDDPDSFKAAKTISKVNSLTPTQKYCLIFMACALLTKRACVIQGNTSSGKSFLIRLFAELVKAKLNVFQMNTDSSVSMLAGQSVLSEDLSDEDIKSFKEYLDVLSNLKEVNDFLEKKGISRDNESSWTPKSFSEMLKIAEEVLSESNPPDKDTIKDTIKNFRELMSPVHRFDNKESELIRAMREGEWVLIDGIESAPPEIAEKIASLCGENPELNLFECGPEFVFSRANGKIHENFQLFITYNPMSSKTSQPIDQSFLIKSVSFTLPEVDSTVATSAQVLFGSMLNQHYSSKVSKEISARLGLMHHLAKQISISRLDSFAGDIQFTGRTLKFITEVFHYHHKHEQNESISKPIAFTMQAFYLNSLLDASFLPEFRHNLKMEFLKDPTDLIKTLEQNEKNLRQRNYFVLLTLRNIQLHILKDDELKYDFHNFINDCNSIQTSDVSYIIKHIEDTITIITRENPKEDDDAAIKFGTLIIINKLLKSISDTLQKTFKVEYSCLKLNEKDLRKEKELVKPLSKLILITSLSSRYISPRCSILLNSILYEDVLFLIENIARNKKLEYIKALIIFAIDKPESIDFIQAIFPGHLFVETEFKNINFILPVIFKAILKNVSFKIYFDDEKGEYILNESENRFFKFCLFLTNKNNFNVGEKSKLTYYSPKRSMKFYQGAKAKFSFGGSKEENINKCNFRFYHILLSIMDKEKLPIQLDDSKVKKYWQISTDLYKQDSELKYNKIVRMSDFFEPTDKPLDMICYAWNLISSLDPKKIDAIAQIVNPLESYILELFNNSFNNCTFDSYENIFDFSKWVSLFDDHLPILLKVVSKIEIANTKNKQVDLDLLERIGKEKDFLDNPPKVNVKFNGHQFIEQLDDAEKSILELSKELKQQKEIQDEMRKLRDELQNSKDFPENDEFRFKLITLIDEIDKTPENLKMIRKKVLQLKDSILKNSMKEEKNKIIWPTCAFTNDTSSTENDLSILKALLKYSRVYSILEKLKTENNRIKYLPSLNSYKSMSASIPSLFDHFLKNDNCPKDLINIAHHELNANFLYDLFEIDRKSYNPASITKKYDDYKTFYEFYKIPEFFNDRIDRNKVTKDELKAIWSYSVDISENFQFILPNITPNDLIYFFVVKAKKNDKYEIKPGPFLKNISLQSIELEKFAPLIDKNQINYLETVADISRVVYGTFFKGHKCPNDPPSIQKDILSLIKNYDPTSIKKQLLDQLILMFKFASYATKFLLDDKKTRTNYRFKFDDLFFLDYFPDKLSKFAKDVIDIYPSFVVWALKNAQLFDQIIRTFKDKKSEIEDAPQKLPFWLHCLRVFSSTICIELFPQGRYQLKPIQRKVNESLFNQISAHLEDKDNNKNTTWLNLLITDVPNELSNQSVHMIHCFLKEICDDQRANQNPEVVEKISQTVDEIISSIFNEDINSYFDKTLPDVDDRTFTSFFNNPATYVVGQMEDTFRNKCGEFLKSADVIDLFYYVQDTLSENRSYIRKFETAIANDKTAYRLYLTTQNKTNKDLQLKQIDEQLKNYIFKYNQNRYYLEIYPDRRKKYEEELNLCKLKLLDFNVKFNEYAEVDTKQNLKKLVKEYRERQNKEKLENIKLFISCSRNRKFSEEEFLYYMDQVAQNAENFVKTFSAYIGMLQIGIGEQYLTDFYNNISIIVESKKSFADNEAILTYCRDCLTDMRTHYDELLKKIETVKNRLSFLPKNYGNKGLKIDSNRIFNYSHNIVRPIEVRREKIKPNKAEDFKISDREDSFEIPVISLSNRNKLICSVDMIKCIIKPIIPTLYSENITVNLLSLVDEPISCDIKIEPKDKMQLTYTKNVGPRNPIKIFMKIPTIRNDECQTLYLKGDINLMTRSKKSLKLPLRIFFQLIPMTVKLYCKHYKLSYNVTSFRVCFTEFFSDDSAKIFISNLYNSETKISNFTYETENDNDAEKPIFEIKSTKSFPKKPYIDVLMQASSPKKLHFTLKVAMSQNLIANILFNCLIVPFKFFLEVYDYKTKSFVSQSTEVIWAPDNLKQKLYFRIMCPCIPNNTKVFTKVFINLPSRLRIINDVNGLDNPRRNPTKSNYWTYTHEFSNNFIFSIECMCEGSCPMSTDFLQQNDSKYFVSAIFARKQKELDNMNQNSTNKINLRFTSCPTVIVDDRTKTIKFNGNKSSGEIPIYIYDHKSTKFIKYTERMKTNDYTGTNKPLIFVTPFNTGIIQAKEQTRITYTDKKVFVDPIDVPVNYLKLGTDGSIMEGSSTFTADIKDIINARNFSEGCKILTSVISEAATKIRTLQKPSTKYTIIGELNDSETSIWFPAFQFYPSMPDKFDVIPENVGAVKKIINKELIKLLDLPAANNQPDYKSLLEKISKHAVYDNTNFGIFIIIMLDKSNLKKVSDLIDAMPEDFRDKCPGINKYIPPDFAFKEDNDDLLLIYSYNIISEFARIFEDRYKEITGNKNSLSSTIPQEKIDEARTKVYYDYFSFDTLKPFSLSNVDSPNYKAHEEYKDYLETTTIQPLRNDQYQHECFILCEKAEPVPDKIINEVKDPGFKIPDMKDTRRNSRTIEKPPEIEIPKKEDMTINSLNDFYSKCSLAASILPAFLMNNDKRYDALILFIKLFDIYKQFNQAERDLSIISESASSFIHSFDSTVCRLKNARVNFNFLSQEEIKIIDGIKTLDSSSEWIIMPKPDLVTLPSTPWKTKEQNARDSIKEATIRVDITNNLNLENDFQTQNTVFSFEPIINDGDDEEKETTKDTELEENINENVELIIQRFAADDSDEGMDEENEDDGKEVNEDGSIKVVRNIGKITKSNINRGKAADSMLSKLKETDGIERVISRIHSMNPDKMFTFKNSHGDNRITDNSLLQTDKTSFPITQFITKASNLISLLVSNASDTKAVRASEMSFPYQLLSVNLLIDCSSYIPESNKMFNVLLVTAFAYALHFLRISYEISVVADQKFRFILKTFEEPHSIKALQRVLDCVLIQRYRTNYPDTFHHAVESMDNSLDTTRKQRAIFLFSDGLDENLVLINAWNKQVLNDPLISYGILVTIPQSFSKDNKTEMETTWKNFAEGTKNSTSITRIAIFESNLNKMSNTQKIVNCFKDVLLRKITVQEEFEYPEDPNPIFDFAIPDLTTKEYKTYDADIKIASKFFVSNEKSLPSAVKKIHIEKLDLSVYRGKTSKIVSGNISDKVNHDNFTSFMHRMSTKLKNIFRSQLETIFKPNKASQTVLSNTGTDFDITALVLNLINPVPDPFIYLEEKGGLIRNYGVSVVIDTSISCFNFIGMIHSVKTVINILCALSSIEIPCVDVILATQAEPMVLCSELPSIHALGEKSSIWPALFSYLLQQVHEDCNLEAAIHCAYDLRRVRGIDYSSILFVLTDGLYMIDRKEKIKERVLASMQLGINVIGIGIGFYPVGITDIFQQAVFAPNPSDIVRAISVCFGDDNPDPLDKISPLFPDVPNNDDLLEIFNKFKEYDQNPIFSELKDKLKRIPAAIDAFSDVYNEEQDYKGKSYKDVTNPKGDNTQMYIANLLQGQKILIVMLYSADYNLEENVYVDKKYLFKNPDQSKDDCVRKAVAFFGIDIVVVEDYDSAMDELMKRENGKCVYYATWVISGWKYEENPFNYNSHHVIAFTQCLLQFWRNGGAVVLFAEGEPLTFQTNYFLEQLTFPDGSKTELRVHGSHKGMETLFGDDEGKLKNNKTFNRSSLEFKKFERPSLAHNIFKIYEGETISYADDDPEIYKPFKPFSKDSDGGISALFYPFDPESNTGDIIIDCGYTKLFDKMTEDGTSKYVQNIAGWTARVEYSITNHIKPKDYRPNRFEFDMDKYINMKFKFDPVPKDLYKDDDGFDINVDELQTLFAVDYSGSIYGRQYYHTMLKLIFDKHYKQGDLIMIWSHYAKYIDYNEMVRIWTELDGNGGTYPQRIIDLIMSTDPPITAQHLIIITDGYINFSNVKECMKMVDENHLAFKQVDTYIVGETGDQSVGITFQNSSPCLTFVCKPPSTEPTIINEVSKFDIRVYGRLDQIDTLGKFMNNFGSLFNVIKTKMMGEGSDEELENKLKEVKNKIIENIKSEGGDEDNPDFERKIGALIKMAQGKIKGIFNNDQITAMLKH